MFDILKEKLSSTLILRGPDWRIPFHISTDASDSAIGAVLRQKEDFFTHAIYFISKNLASAELNYTMTEKECLAVVYTINKFRNNIIGYEVFVHTDHSAIKYLMNKPITNDSIIMWILLLQEFDITIVDRLRRENQVAYFLSRLNHEGKLPPHFLTKEKRKNIKRGAPYSCIKGALFNTGPDMITRRCVREDEMILS